jgi:hypothetical protein
MTITVLFHMFHTDMLDQLPLVEICLYDNMPSALEGIMDHIKERWLYDDDEEEFDEERLFTDIVKKYDKGESVGVYWCGKPKFCICKFIQSDVYFGEYDAHSVGYAKRIENDFSDESLNIWDYVINEKGKEESNEE